MNNNPLEKNIYINRFGKEINQRKAMWKVLCEGFFQKFISSKDTVLDIASGYGEFINNIQCKKKIACDINPDSKKYVSNTTQFILGSSVKIKLKNGSVDKIFISNFFEHITRDEIIKTIHECYRILKPGGQVLVLQPNIRFCSKDYWMFFDHITPIDDRALTEVFSLAKFKQIYKLEKFLPYTTKSKLPKTSLIVKLYISLPFLWKWIGKQSFLIFEK